MIDRTEEFAAHVRVPVSDVTHCVRIGRRGSCDVYATGWWTPWGYSTATVEHTGLGFGTWRYTCDSDIHRE